MRDHIKKTAELLKKGEAVIFYTVGSDTFLFLKELKNRFGLRPTAICDGDPRKQGRAWNGLEGLEVLSPKSAMEKYPSAHWLIPSLNYRYQIMGYLTRECGIAPERIVNYEPIRKFRSCVHLAQSFFYNRTGELTFCCSGICPRVSACEDPDAASWEALRDELRKTLEEDRVPKESLCYNCSLIKEDYYPVEPKAVYLNYFCNSVCNYRCSYCTVSHAGPLEKEVGRNTVDQIIRALRERDLLSENYYLDFVTAGEPTIYPGRKKVYREFDGERIALVTNGFVFDEDFFALTSRKKALIITSIDAGTRETYQKLKGVDGFDRVRENMKRYTEGPMCVIEAKYIFVPGVNDTPEDVDGFVAFCVETKSTFVVIAVDFFSIDELSERTESMMRRMVEGLWGAGILCIPFTANLRLEYVDTMRRLMDPGSKEGAGARPSGS